MWPMVRVKVSMNALGVAPSAAVCGFGDGCSFGELDHGVENPDVGSPLGVGRAELGAEQPGAGPLAGADGAGKPDQGFWSAQVALDEPARFGEPRIVRCWQGEGLPAGRAQPIA